jgi:hypothetical protein
LSRGKAVGGGSRQIRNLINTEHRDEPFWAKSPTPYFQEKPLSFRFCRPYRKPTQVGRVRIPRRLRELR